MELQEELLKAVRGTRTTSKAPVKGVGGESETHESKERACKCTESQKHSHVDARRDARSPRGMISVSASCTRERHSETETDREIYTQEKETEEDEEEEEEEAEEIEREKEATDRETLSPGSSFEAWLTRISSHERSPIRR